MDVVPVPPSGEDGGWADGLTGKGREVVFKEHDSSPGASPIDAGLSRPWGHPTGDGSVNNSFP